MSSFTLQNLRDTLWQQVVNATGLPQEDVIWYTQAGSRPGRELAKLWVGINMLSMTPINELEYQAVTDTPGAPTGNEVTVTTTGQYEIEFSLHVFSMNIVGGDGQAPYYMQKIRSYFGRQSTEDAFVAIHAPIIDRGPILHVPTIVNTKYESRANMSLRVRAAVDDSETTTFIERVTGTTTVEGRVTPFDTNLV